MAAAGRLLEGRDPRRVTATLLLAQGAAIAWVALARPVVPLLVAVAAVTLAGRVKLAARGALTGKTLTGPGRARGRAWLRGLTNAGTGVGSLVAAAVTADGTRAAYTAALLGAAALPAVAGVPLGRVPAPARCATPPAASSRSSSALRDRRAVTGACSACTTCCWRWACRCGSRRTPGAACGCCRWAS